MPYVELKNGRFYFSERWHYGLNEAEVLGQLQPLLFPFAQELRVAAALITAGGPSLVNERQSAVKFPGLIDHLTMVVVRGAMHQYSRNPSDPFVQHLSQSEYFVALATDYNTKLAAGVRIGTAN